MTWKTGLAASVAAFGLLAGLPGIGVLPAFAGCMAGDHIDRSTAKQATEKMEHAGYAKVHDLRKGCDNYWHGLAMKDGKPVMIVLSPAGQVMLEGASRLALEGAPVAQSAQAPR
jgi:hypothetical protein